MSFTAAFESATAAVVVSNSHFTGKQELICYLYPFHYPCSSYILRLAGYLSGNTYGGFVS
jgi:hypothetical protein